MSDRNWLGDPEPVFVLCLRCGHKFVGNIWRAFCKPCDEAVEKLNEEHTGPAAGVSD